MRASLQLYCYEGIDNNHFIEPPIGACSGCLYRDRILSVLHGYPNKDSQIIAAYIESETLTKNLSQILSPEWMSSHAIDNQGRIINGHTIDFFSSTYDTTKNYSFVVFGTDGLVCKLNRYKFQNIIEPNLAEEYFFHGNTHPAIDACNGIITSCPQFALCTFTGRLTENDFYYEFELNENIQKADDYRGCSGAPIMNLNGELVSLVNSGKVGTPYLYGVNLQKVYSILDAVRGHV